MDDVDDVDDTDDDLEARLEVLGFRWMLRSRLRNLSEGPLRTTAPPIRRRRRGHRPDGATVAVRRYRPPELSGRWRIGIETAIVLSYVLDDAWTFRGSQKTGTVDYLGGVLETNVVRGMAIPIQLAVLFLLVEMRGIPYLLANAVGNVVSESYRYVLDARWPWG